MSSKRFEGAVKGPLSFRENYKPYNEELFCVLSLEKEKKMDKVLEFGKKNVRWIAGAFGLVIAGIVAAVVVKSEKSDEGTVSGAEETETPAEEPEV
jgi:hypothetical protein